MNQLQIDLRNILGLFKSTEKIEKHRHKLLSEYKRFQHIAASEEFKKFITLRDFVNAPEFKERKKTIEAEKYSGSDLQIKEKEYCKKHRSKPIKNYYQFKDSTDRKFFITFQESEKLKEFNSLQDYHESGQYDADKKQFHLDRNQRIKTLREKKTDWKSKKQSYRWFFKLTANKAFQDFLKHKDTETYAAYRSLKNQVNGLSVSELRAESHAALKKWKSEKKQLLKRLKTLTKAHKKNKDFNNQKELERIENTLSSGNIDKEIEAARLQNQETYQKLTAFKKQKKDPHNKNIDKYLDSDSYTQYNHFKESQELKDYLSLDEYIHNDFQKNLQAVKKEKFSQTKTAQKHKDFLRLKKDREIKRFFRIKKSGKLKNFEALHGADEIARYEQLRAYINSEEFRIRKTYLKNRKKFRLSDEYRQLQEYKKLKKEADIRFYLKNQNNKHYAELARWENTFTEQFDGKQQPELWSSRSALSADFLKDNYSQWNELQYYTEIENISMNDGKLRIELKAEEREGTAWHPTMGFIPKKFSYTSGQLHSYPSFKQLYGKFEFKARFTKGTPAKQTVSLTTGKPRPFITLVGASLHKKNKVSFGFLPENGKTVWKHLQIPGFGKKYHIYTLIWKPDSMEWRVNDTTIFKWKRNPVQIPLFWSLNLFTTHKIAKASLPLSFQTEWIKAYKEKNK
jgi:hypothetical protein